MDRTAQESTAQTLGAKFPISTGNLPGVCSAYLMIRDALGLRIRPLTQILTQNGKGAGGSGGGNKTGKHPTPEQKRPKSSEKPPPAPLAAAHNPKVVGSNPAPATRKTAVSNVKAAVFVIFSGDSFLRPLEEFNFNSTCSKIQAFFKNTSASISALRWSAFSMTWA